MPPSRAFIDANVFYSITISDLLVECARAGLFRAFWSERVHAEWTGHLKTNRPDLNPARIDARKSAMDAAVYDALVTDFDHLIPSLQLPDASDRHILAAAMVARATCIVTFDLKHFPPAMLTVHGIIATDPDAFLSDLLAFDPDEFLKCVREVLRRMKNPRRTFDEYLAQLTRARLPKLAKALADRRPIT